MNGTRIQSVSMGKGYVRWEVVLPPLKKRPMTLEKDYEDLTSACVAVKQHFLEDEVDPATVSTVLENAPDGEWGSERK